MEAWLELLRSDDSDAAWDALVGRYRPLIVSAVRYYLRDDDDVMDVFALVCESLRARDFARLRQYAAEDNHRASFSTWLVAVVRNRTVDWLRNRDGRTHRLPPRHLGTLQQRIYQHVFVEHRTHRECYHLLAIADGLTVSEHEFSRALAETYHAVPRPPDGSRAALRSPEPLPPDLEAFAPGPESVGEDSSRLNEAMARLKDEDRLAVQLFVIDELSAAEVAAIVGWPSAKTVYNRVSRALRALKSWLSESAGVSK